MLVAKGQTYPLKILGENKVPTEMTIDHFDASNIPFPVVKVKGTEVVWLHSDVQLSTCTTTKQLHERIIDKFSYCIHETACFKDLTFLHDDTVVMQGERYGGSGLGQHGGGVRCGNIEDFQVKGIGVNPLVGKDAEQGHSHTYGGLDLHSAILETIFSNVLEKVLPVGVVRIIGVIHTHTKAALRKGQRSPGALMIRESCIRPAHFIACRNHRIPSRYRDCIYSDQYRTKRVHLDLKNLLETDENYVQLLASFLGNCAKQFGFTSIFGIGHRALSPSNIAITGQWLDLPRVTFAGAGVNYNARKPLSIEPALPLKMVEELLYTYSKYNAKPLNILPLKKFYLSSLDDYKHRYFLDFLGLPTGVSKESIKSETRFLYSIFNKVNLQNIAKGVKEDLSENAPSLEFLIALYALNNSPKKYHSIWQEKFKIDENSTKKIYLAFRSILNHTFNETGYLKNVDTFSLATAIFSIKRAGQMRFFHFQNGLNEGIDELCKNPDIQDISNFINIYDSISDWVFHYDFKSNITIFQSDKLAISFQIKTAKFIAQLYNENLQFEKLSDLLNWVEKLDRKLFIIHGYDFTRSIKNLKLVQS